MPLSRKSGKTVRWVVLASIMLSMSMVAFEATIVATAMPQIVADLGGLSLYSWVFSSYLLTQTALTVVFGKLADLYGRKPVVIAGIAIFLLGSVLAGFAWSMVSLVAFRLVQGIGAGALQPAAMTVIADLYPGRERGKIQGWLASVWAMSAVIGPLLGGIIVHNVNWAWIFWINVPIGIAAVLGYTLFLHEDVALKRGSVDFAGAILAALSIGALMLLLTEASSAGLGFELGAAAVCLVASVLFVMQERRARDPMISFELWRYRPLASANALTLLANMALMGLTTFLPIYVQGVLGQSALVAGFALTAVMIGWPAGATIAARINHRISPRRLTLIGSVLLPAGAAVFALMGAGSSAWLAGFASMVMGFGMGLISVTSLLLIQGSVEAHERGAGTASNMFARNLGSTLGAAVLGAILNFGLLRDPSGVKADQLRDLLAGSGAMTVADDTVRAALGHAVHLTFVVMFLLTLGCIFIALFIPRTQAVRRAVAAGEAPAREERDRGAA